MAKQKRRRDCPLWIRLVLVAFAAFLTLAVMVAIALWKENHPPERETDTVAVSESDTVALADAYELGQGLRLVGMVSATGNFPEDGSDVFLPNMFCITVENTTDRMLRTASVSLTVNGQTYIFDMNSIPAGATVRVYEKNRAAAPNAFYEFRAECSYAVFLETEPTVGEDRLQITVQDQGITVKNTGDEDITHDIFVYYKSRYDGVYVGGITYRVSIKGLRAGDEVTAYAAHALESYSEVVFVEYGE